jgi:hypothetical protein
MSNVYKGFKPISFNLVNNMPNLGIQLPFGIAEMIYHSVEIDTEEAALVSGRDEQVALIQAWSGQPLSFQEVRNKVQFSGIPQGYFSVSS